ncbi:MULTISPECIES: gephyrin-like molybdotransferase Glp [Asticcacaulis]|uniref:molybdopterin molybdotransferase MoeA n=1 Tax=Asticcacaulis TaxID=76890 RepID=UPI001AE4A25C|nr:MULTISPECIES: gephyrin-like molybdotransferase Glp [Asticcacaulis]MBP2160224.1 molybdopterin molybdotransferase [Asticcacaulis solisilvae]MDR6801269.1 molybdopterin molybdotransferase [Asticcacaulis sp. BE141]
MPARRNVPMTEAVGIVRSGALTPQPETVALNAAVGRVLAADVLATRDQPPFRSSAMDGYAVRKADLGHETLAVIGESAAGARFEAAVGDGLAVRIFTGAPVPDDCDAVIIQENTEKIEGGIRLLPDAVTAKSNNIRPKGGDFRTSDPLLANGDRLDPWRLSLAAAAGRANLEVVKRPRIAVLCTGDELILPGQTPGPDQIFESGSLALMALIAEWGGEAAYLGVEGDGQAAITEAVRHAEADLIVTVGGASVGDYDLVKPALGALGLTLEFETLNLRPGKPTAFGQLADGRRTLSLPGNPASAFVVAQLLLKPWIEASLGMAEQSPFIKAALAVGVGPAGPRETYMRARLETSEDGRQMVTPFRDQDSSLVSVFARANALLRLPANAQAQAAGAVVDIIPLNRV